MEGEAEDPGQEEERLERGQSQPDEEVLGTLRTSGTGDWVMGWAPLTQDSPDAADQQDEGGDDPEDIGNDDAETEVGVEGVDLHLQEHETHGAVGPLQQGNQLGGGGGVQQSQTGGGLILCVGHFSAYWELSRVSVSCILVERIATK